MVASGRGCISQRRLWEGENEALPWVRWNSVGGNHRKERLDIGSIHRLQYCTDFMQCLPQKWADLIEICCSDFPCFSCEMNVVRVMYFAQVVETSSLHSNANQLVGRDYIPIHRCKTVKNKTTILCCHVSKLCDRTHFPRFVELHNWRLLRLLDYKEM